MSQPLGIIITLPNLQKRKHIRIAAFGAMAILFASGLYYFFNFHYNGAIAGALFVLIAFGWCALAYGLFPWVYNSKRVKKTSALWMVSGMLKIALIILQLALIYGNIKCMLYVSRHKSETSAIVS